MLIYKVTFPNNKVYIGQTKNSLALRKSQHLSKSKIKNTPFYSALKKYKNLVIWEEFFFVFDKKDINHFEQYFIKYFKSTNLNFGYNLTSGGERNFTHSKVTKENIKIKRSFQIITKEHKNNISNSLKDKPKTKQHIENARNASYNSRQTQEYKNKLSKVHMGKVFSEQSKIKIAQTKGITPFKVYKNDEFIGEFSVGSICAKKLKLNNSKITQCLKGKRKSHKGYTFKREA